MLNRKRVLFLIISTLVSIAHGKVETPTYTLMDTMDYKFEGPLKCEIAVVVSADKSEVRVVRLDPRKGMYSVNYFAKSTVLFGNYGLKLSVRDELNLGDAVISTFRASFNFKDSHHDLILKAMLVDPITGKEDVKEKTIPLDQEFINDHPKKCLK